MNLDSAKAQMEAATQSAKDQIELNEQVLVNKLDAADRVILFKAANTVLSLTPAIASDPT